MLSYCEIVIYATKPQNYIFFINKGKETFIGVLVKVDLVEQDRNSTEVNIVRLMLICGVVLQDSAAGSGQGSGSGSGSGSESGGESPKGSPKSGAGSDSDAEAPKSKKARVIDSEEDE